MQTIDAANCRSDRAAELFDNSLNVIHRRADRLFAWLMIAQWIGGIGVALWISPRTWIGAESQTHWHVWAAIFLGGAVTSLPVYFAHVMPGRALTRHTIAVAQMLFSALLIHLTGGRIETHFHVFGSLAFLAFYRDWRVLVTATVVVAFDHAMRGMFFPQSVFGVLTASPWRWIEHTGWVLFEDFFLFISIKQSTRIEVAERRADLEVSEQLEMRVKERTAELADANEALQAENTERKRGEEALRQAEEKYRGIFENALEGIFQTTPDGRFIAANFALARILGFDSPEELIGARTDIAQEEYVDPQSREEFKRLLDENGSVLDFELEACRKDGSKIWMSENVVAVRDAKGTVIHYEGTAQDITKRKQAEDALRISEAHLQTVVENLSEGVIVSDLNGKLLHWNRSALKIHGIANVDEGARKLTELVDTFELSAIDRTRIPVEEWPLSRILRGENLRDLELRVRNIKAGWQHIFNYGGTLVRDGNNRPLMAIVTITDITERKGAEEMLRGSEERYRTLFESNPNPMWVYDLETLSFLAVNAAAVRHYGYAQDEFLAMTIKDIRPPEDIPALMDDLSHETAGLDSSTQWRHRKKDGALIDVEITSHEQMWLGRAAKLVLINDISVRKDAEKHLAQMEGRYRGLLEAAPDAMVVVNQGGEIVLLNLQAEKQFGYRRDELVGQKVKNIIPEGFAERLVADDLRSAEDALAQQIGTGIELTGRRKNGSDFPIEIMLSPLESADGILVTAAIRDISERKRAEERLREQADMLNRAHDAIIVRNFEDQRIVFWNSGAERLYGWSASEAIGRLTGELLYADSKEREGPLKLLSSTGDFRGELKQITKDGREVIVDARATIVRNPDGTPRCVLSMNTDITEQKKLEMQLLRAQRLESIGTLASGVAHDLNNILTPILICAEVLKGNPVQEDLPALVSMIEESAKRGANVVKQVLTFARGIEGEHVVIKPSHLIQEMIDVAQKTFPKTIEILGRYTDDLWSIKCDPTQLHQVLVNLSLNARDAMPNGGTITIGAENFDVDEHYASMTPDAKPGPHVILRVTDTGRGMPRAIIDKIFDPFFTTKEVGKGTGLGLSTTLGIVKSHSGFISVYSEPGQGTTFKMFLPATMTDEDLRQSKTSVVPIQGNGELILVVDDEPNILGITKMILEKHRYDVLSAGDGPEALAIFAQQMQSINLVLTDLSMPYMDGVALVRALKKMRPDVSIVASTGQGEQAGVAALQSLGVKNFLTKPYNTQQLLATTHDTLQKKTELVV